MCSNNFSNNLIFLRSKYNLSQIELASILDISRQNISNYENEVREPNLTNIIKIANFFKCSLDELILSNKSELHHKLETLNSISYNHYNKFNFFKLSNFSSNLIFLRTKNNLSQSKLAKYLDISRETISYYENEVREPNLTNIIKIANFFNYSIDELIFTEQINSSDKFKISNKLDANTDLLNDLIDKKIKLEKMNIIITKKIEILNLIIEYIEKS